jgi:hypothetical protein
VANVSLPTTIDWHAGEYGRQSRIDMNIIFKSMALWDMHVRLYFRLWGWGEGIHSQTISERVSSTVSTVTPVYYHMLTLNRQKVRCLLSVDLHIRSIDNVWNWTRRSFDWKEVTEHLLVIMNQRCLIYSLAALLGWPNKNLHSGGHPAHINTFVGGPDIPQNVSGGAEL